MKKLFLIVMILFCSISLTACGVKEDMLDISFDQKGNEVELKQYDTENPVVAMYIEDYGTIVMELYPEIAPNTVNNFISLVKSGFYDNNTFHRLVPGFVLQGGDPNGMGTGGPGYTIKGEFSKNGFENDLKHTKWVVSMARSQDYDSAGSQFFIMLGDAENLDGEYAAFGKVIDGKENINRIVKNEGVSDADSGKLTHNLTIKKAVIDLKGKEYAEVKKISES
ncbi:MAG: peptidylprolyl isomerase [bacterium]|nr:peptidylprolyl isomerase [Mycoplasmatota bacterium]MDD6757714.1 peptidylprolyl isomerase [bacterium]MDY2908473.1 peptidylprolyl isomerase [Candidatus Faecimonas sp.]